MIQPNIDSVKFLTLNFEGYFACRIATDPDPTNEERGMSGYTMALSTEDNLDQVIRLQMDEKYIERNLRPPGRLIGMDNNWRRGVEVISVTYDGKKYNSNLLKAKINLLGQDGIFNGPIFESRNNVTGSDDELSFVITPFKLQIKEDKKKGAVEINAEDILNPSLDAKEQEIWAITDPSIYGRRLPTGYAFDDEEVKKAVNVFDQYGYFRDRRRFMEDEIKRQEGLIANLELKIKQYKESGNHTKEIKEAESKIEHFQVEIEKFKSRIHQLEFWGIRVINKINLRANWDFEINGPKSVKGGIKIWNKEDKSDRMGLKPVTHKWNWPIKFWFGGWDGDMLSGFMRGELKIPVTVGGLRQPKKSMGKKK